MDALTIRIEEASPPVLHLAGEIDVATADLLQTTLKEALASDRATVIDMAGVSFIDVTGLRVLIDAAESLDGQAPLTLANAPLAARLLALLGLKDKLAIELRNGG